MNIVEATELAIAEAHHLTPMDQAAVEALRALARKIQAWDRIVEFALEDVAAAGGRPTVPQNDNVSLSAYLKCCDQLGLTPSGRKALDLKGVRAGGKLNDIRSVAEQRARSAGRAAPAAAKSAVRKRASADLHSA